MRKLALIASVCIFLSILIVNLVSADIVRPTVTNVYFNQCGVPYNNQVKFSVNCWGYSWPVGTPDPMKTRYSLSKVLSYSATCPYYGCPIYQNLYLGYKHIDYCSLHGVLANGRNFDIFKFASTPFPNCVWEFVDGEMVGKCYLNFNIPMGGTNCNIFLKNLRA